MAKKRVHLVGIAGTGMGALAGLLKEKGFQVQGSDTSFYPPMGPFLRGLGILLFEGYSRENLFPLPDLAVIGNVVRPDNPEARAILGLKIPYYSFPQALSEFWLKYRETIVVSGTHGKTTTTGLLVSALWQRSPGFLVGGILKDLDKGFSQGKQPWFVIEGDEYDTAFFDKTPKFLHYTARHAILTGIEFDHADIYKDLGEIKEAFKALLSTIPRDGVVAACADSPHLMGVIGSAHSRVVLYGMAEGSCFRLLDWKDQGDSTLFKVSANGRPVSGRLRLPGRHNVINAVGVIALLSELGFPEDEVLEGISRFRGVKRRQEVITEENGIILIDDFAHHPTAVRETLLALKEHFPGRRLIAAFEPRTNTSRRAIFQDVYPRALCQADLICVRDVPDPEKAPPGDRFSSRRLTKDLMAMGKNAFFFKDGREIALFLRGELRKGDVVVVLSNGGFDGLVQDLSALLRTH